jgi:diadenosine tetraphosphate (Ap4A) HIT family hydrolase
MSKAENSCIFCIKSNYEIVEEKKFFFIIRDTAYPVTKHHTLIISNRHIDDYFKLTSEELNELNQILKEQKEKLKLFDSTISGYNIGVNVGKDAGQSIMHCHIHLIPRRKGDVDDPKGGVRGVIPSKQKYVRK